MNRRVKHARLHSADTFVTGLGNLGHALPGSFTGMELHMTQDGLYITLRGIEAFVPAANVKIVELYPEEKQDKPAKVK